MATKRDGIAGGYLRGSIAGSALALAVASPFAFPATARGAQAQPPAAAPVPQIREIRPGVRVNSSLTREVSDAREDYRLHLEANDSVQIDMDSPGFEGAASGPTTAAQARAGYGFDTYLELRPPGSDEPLMMNDDRGDGTLNSRLIFTAPSAGDYVVRARPLGGISADQLNTYSLTITALRPPPPPTEFPGSRVDGELGPDSPVGDSFGSQSRYAAYWVNGPAGERVQFDMVSSGTTPSLQLLDSEARLLAFEVGEQNEVRLITVLPATGRYLVRAQVPPDQTVRYSLSLARATASATVENPAQIRVGETVNGALTLSSSAEPRGDGSGQLEFFYTLYSLRVRAGETLTVTLETTGFAPVIEAGTLSVLGFVPARIGNAADSSNARLVLQPFQPGTVYLRVRPPGLGVGTFRLRAVPGMVPPPGQ